MYIYSLSAQSQPSDRSRQPPKHPPSSRPPPEEKGKGRRRQYIKRDSKREAGGKVVERVDLLRMKHWAWRFDVWLFVLLFSICLAMLFTTIDFTNAPSSVPSLPSKSSSYSSLPVHHD
ncbi:hypothetical protein Tsubulata_014050 [Turnera subulata]|uniref:Uncharacterized protein n=1 Tax=Turnera subulata TaxID=218843 RepID=A0A9Q0GHK4_9ROSI|nr:hypothetical protein Tsubulata_014050 [Turnera subulata]KAJ4850017.1 hypothetical protein Tsubulata_014050 [Turnera subulata]